MAPQPDTGHDLRERHRRLREEMAASDLDCLLVPINDSFTYLSNVATVAFGAYLLFPREGEPTLLVNPVAFWEDGGDGLPLGGAYAGGELGETILATTACDDVRGVRPGAFASAIAAWLGDRDLLGSRIGVVGREFDFPRGGGGLVGQTGLDGLNPALAAELKERLPAAELVDGTSALATVRVRKEPSEIASLRQAARLADRCRQAFLEEAAKPERTDADLFAAYWDTLYRSGGASSWWFMLGAVPSANPRKQNSRDAPIGSRLADGDVVIGEFLPAWRDGYVGHAEACAVKGRLANAAAYERVEAVCFESLAALIGALAPGVEAGEITALADAPIEAAGFDRGAPFAYGLGLFGLEPPLAGFPAEPGSPPPPSVLEPGTVLCLIVHVFDPRSGATVRTGCSQLITAEGSECLNETPPQGLVVVG